MANVKISVEGLDKLIKGLERFPREIARYMSQAGHEAGEDVILPTQGLRKYPPATAANMPPTPYYIRGRGTQLKRGNLGNSERLGTQFYIKRTGWNTAIGNRASYAKYVIGEQQASFMAPKGWRKLFDVAKDKKAKIQKVYQAWVDKALRDFGL
jgi:hypothetical protein